MEELRKLTNQVVSGWRLEFHGVLLAFPAGLEGDKNPLQLPIALQPHQRVGDQGPSNDQTLFLLSNQLHMWDYSFVEP
jgi:hypothetical protein